MTKDEFDRMVYEHQGIILKVCRAFSSQKEDQKDLFQDILYKLWRGKESFKGDSKPSTWIYKVSLNHAIDVSRKKQIEFSDLEIEQVPAPRPESDFDLEALYLAIKTLSPVKRAIIILYLDQLSYKEIGEVMGLSEKNVSVKLVRIRKELKKQYLNFTKTTHDEQH